MNALPFWFSLVSCHGDRVCTDGEHSRYYSGNQPYFSVICLLPYLTTKSV